MPPSLLQSAFNTFANYDVDIEKITGNKFVTGYAQNLLDLEKSFGTIDWKVFDAKEGSAALEALSGNLIGAGLEAFGESAKVGLGVAASYLAGTGGPPGVAVGAVTAIAGLAIDAVLDKIAAGIESDPIPYVKGDWVVVDDNGTFERRRMMGQFDIDSENLEEMAHETSNYEHIHLGIFLGTEGQAGDIKLFDVQNGTVRTEHAAHVKRVPEEEQQSLNGIPILRAIKGGTEPTATFDQIKTETQVRIGDAVTYQGDLYEITGYEAEEVSIVCNGHYVTTTWDQIGPAINSTTATPLDPRIPGSFTSIPGGFNNGEWVWFPEGPDSWLLGVVQVCRGDKCLVVPASDLGVPSYIDVRDLHKNKDQYSSGELGKWRLAVVEGDSNNIRVYLPSKKYPNMIRVDKLAIAKIKWEKQPAESYMTYGGESEEDAPGYRGSAPVANQEDQVYRVDGIGREPKQEQVKREEKEADKKSDNTGMFLFGAAILAGIIFMYN